MPMLGRSLRTRPGISALALLSELGCPHGPLPSSQSEGNRLRCCSERPRPRLPGTRYGAVAAHGGLSIVREPSEGNTPPRFTNRAVEAGSWHHYLGTGHLKVLQQTDYEWRQDRPSIQCKPPSDIGCYTVRQPTFLPFLVVKVIRHCTINQL